MHTWRSPGTVAVGVAAVVAGGVTGVAVAVRLLADAALGEAVALVLAAALATTGVVLCLRPRVLVSDFGVAVVNPLRTTFLPWTDLDQVGFEDRLWLRTRDGRVLEAYAVRASRRRAREQQRMLGTLRHRGLRARRGAAASTARARWPAA